MTDEALGDEETIIRTYLKPLAAGYPGAFELVDDCAAISPPPGMDLVVKTDPVRSGVHFLPDDPPEDIAWKALAVNISDLAAKGAHPLVYLAALSFPEPPRREWMRAFADGLDEAQAAFGCHLIGGDTDRAPGPMSAAITAIGTVPTGRMVRRATAKPGDLIFVSGTIGDAALGLQLRLAAPEAMAWPLTASQRTQLLQRYRRPQPRLSLVDALRASASAAMDVSDGLIKDLERMCRASSVGAIVRLADVPLSDAGRAVTKQDRLWPRRAVVGGDDYEVLATVPPAHAESFSAAARAAGIAVAGIGEIVSTSGLRVLDAAGREIAFGDKGWDHFRVAQVTDTGGVR